MICSTNCLPKDYICHFWACVFQLLVLSHWSFFFTKTDPMCRSNSNVSVWYFTAYNFESMLTILCVNVFSVWTVNSFTILVQDLTTFSLFFSNNPQVDLHLQVSLSLTLFSTLLRWLLLQKTSGHITLWCCTPSYTIEKVQTSISMYILPWAP